MAVAIWEERMGRAAYEEYTRELAFVRGHPGFAPWDALPEDIQRVWGRVARAVAHKIAEDQSSPLDRQKAGA